MRIWASALRAESRASISAQSVRSLQASRTTVKARAMVAADAPERWPTLCTKVGPQRLTSEFTTCKAVISRRRRWPRIAGSYVAQEMGLTFAALTSPMDQHPSDPIAQIFETLAARLTGRTTVRSGRKSALIPLLARLPRLKAR